MLRSILPVCFLFALSPAPQDPLRTTAEHTLLQRRVGTWEAELVTSLPDGREHRTKGTLQVDRHTDWHTIDSFHGEFLGMPLLGHGMNSWCPMRRKFVSSWTDSMSPAPLLLTGDHDEKSRTLTMTGECFSPGGVLAPCRTVTEFVDADHMTWTFFANGTDGKQREQLRIVYTRQKA